MIRHILRTTALAAVATAVTLGAAIAQTPKPIDQFKYWGAFTFDDAKQGKVCYILSIPTAKAPGDRDHGDVYFLVSQKPGKSGVYEPQVEVGYPLKADADVKVTVDGKSFPMFARKNNAWLKDVSKEKDLVAAMRKGSTMKVSGTSARGTQTSYTYSLSGVSAALAAIKTCK